MDSETKNFESMKAKQSVNDSTPLTTVSHHPFSYIVLDALLEHYAPELPKERYADLIWAIQESYKKL